MRLRPIEEQVVVVMGASSGIGRETARRFARRGARVVVAARSMDDLTSLVAEIRGEGGDAQLCVADVTDIEQVRSVAELAMLEYGRLDTWAHLSSVSVFAPFENTTPEEFRRVLQVNVLGQVNGALAALPHLRRHGGGALIHVSSVESVVSLPWNSAYAASKHAITGFVDALRLELLREGAPISVTNILPATINTPLFEKARSKLGFRPQGTPPFYEPGVVADTILYAAEHPVRDLYAGGAAKVMATLQKLAPRLMDRFLVRTAFQLQTTHEAKPAGSPDNLYAPLAGYGRAEGRLGPRHVHSRSLYTWLEQHPIVSGCLLVSAGLTTSLLAAQKLHRPRFASAWQ